jgi:hypothetical protein
MLGDGLRKTNSRLRTARTTAAVRRWDFNPEDVGRLEAAHAAVLEAATRADRRLARDKDKAKLNEAVAAEQAILSWMGLESWLEYRLRAAGVPEHEDIEAVVDLTDRPPAEEPATPVNGSRADWRSVRPLVRHVRP